MDKKFVISVAVLMSFMSGCISVQQIQKSDQTAAVNQGGATQPQASASSSPAATPTPVSSSTPASPVSSSTPTSTTEIDLTGPVRILPLFHALFTWNLHKIMLIFILL